MFIVNRIATVIAASCLLASCGGDTDLPGVLDPTPEPSLEPTPTATPSPTAEPTLTPTAAPSPTVAPSPEPTLAPTMEPTAEPTLEPTPEPTSEPSAVPTLEPSAVPTLEPTPEPTPEPSAEPTPQPSAEPTPEEPVADLVIQENEAGFCDLDGSVDSNNPGYVGPGFANTSNEVGARIVWDVVVPDEGFYMLEWRYANGGEARAATVKINGSDADSLEFDTTGSWASWTVMSANLALSAGNNIIELVSDSGEGLANIDSLGLIGNDLQVGDCSDLGGSSSSSSSSSSSGTSSTSSGGSSSTSSSGGSSSSSSGGNDGINGWASVSACGPDGTTGGGDGEPTVTVSNASDLKAQLTSSGPKVIALNGQISGVGGLSGVKDKTLIGINGARISGGMGFSGARNVIVKNIEFADGSNDTFELSGSECVWFDHNIFRDGRDGNLDIVRASNYVTVSWNKFYYTRGHGHMLSNLNGNGNGRTSDRDKLKITFHHNWWGAGVKERMPRTRYGDMHIYNNYYKYEKVSGDAGQNYCIGAGIEAELLIENNYFDESNTPIRFHSDSGTAEVVHRGNIFYNTTGDDPVSRGDAFDPPYSYTLDNGENVKELVRAGAGPQ